MKLVKNHAIYFLVAVLLLPGVVFGYYNPGTPVGFVNDFGELLTPEQESSLEQKITAFEQESSNEIAVVTIPNLADDTIENFAVELFQKWGIGKDKNDNGVLLLIARNDREMRIEVGYGLEGALTDLESYGIIQKILIPNFKNGDYYTGIDGAVDGIIAATTGEYTPEAKNIEENGDFSAFLLFFLFILLWLARLLGMSKSWWAGGVIGGFVGLLIGLIKGFVFIGILSLAILIPLGLLFDFLVSKSAAKHKALGTLPWWVDSGRKGGGGSGFGGGFGGFGGGMSGGGGASGKW